MIDAKGIARAALAMVGATMVACTGAAPSDTRGSAGGIAHSYAGDATTDGAISPEAGVDAVASDAVSDAPLFDGAIDGGCLCGYEDPKECAEAQQKCANDPKECKEVAEKCACEDECRD